MKCIQILGLARGGRRRGNVTDVQGNKPSFLAQLLVAAVMYFRQYEVYASIRRGSLERRHQTTVGSHTCCGHMLKFISV